MVSNGQVMGPTPPKRETGTKALAFVLVPANNVV